MLGGKPKDRNQKVILTIYLPQRKAGTKEEYLQYYLFELLGWHSAMQDQPCLIFEDCWKVLSQLQKIKPQKLSLLCCLETEGKDFF